MLRNVTSIGTLSFGPGEERIDSSPLFLAELVQFSRQVNDAAQNRCRVKAGTRFYQVIRFCDRRKLDAIRQFVRVRAGNPYGIRPRHLSTMYSKQLAKLNFADAVRIGRVHYRRPT